MTAGQSDGFKSDFTGSYDPETIYVTGGISNRGVGNDGSIQLPPGYQLAALANIPKPQSGANTGGKSPSRISCIGAAQLLAGNPANIGKEGFPGVKVTNNSAAVAPQQFTGFDSPGPLMRAIGASTFGVVAYHNPDGSIGHEWFFNLTQSVGNTNISRSDIVDRASGHLLVEIVGGTATDYNAGVVINMPNLNQGCPQGTVLSK